MPLLQPDNTELTTEQKQQQAVRRLNSIFSSTFDQMQSAFNQGMKLVYNNPRGLTPQQVFDAIGTEGGKALQLAELLATTVSTAAAADGAPSPDLIARPENLDFTVNEDGTVTVSEIDNS